jgi:uncharacterized iron-regulated membrane protein
MKLRPLIFWPHLIAGVLAGTVILLMSVTGVLLTYERQILAWADSQYRSVAPTPDATPLSVDMVVGRLRASHPDLIPTGFTLRSDAGAPLTVMAGRRTVYVDRYTGAMLGEASGGGVRTLMSELRAWHRWLAVDGNSRPVARAITGWSNFIFLFIVMSGVYLWFPRKWAWQQVRNVVLFKADARGRARDFNWHNVIGSWCAIPLFIVVLSALPISFGWFNALVYRAVGDAPPPPAGAAAARSADRGNTAPGQGQAAETPTRRADAAADASVVESFDALWARAERHVPGWRTITLRLPASHTAPLAFAIDKGDGGQPHLRSTLTLERRTREVVSYEAFSDLPLGRRIRNVMRFAHTGEVLGIPGQTVAGAVSAGGAVLVWTGLALAWRRFRSWVGRRRRTDEATLVSTAA